MPRIPLRNITRERAGNEDKGMGIPPKPHKAPGSKEDSEMINVFVHTIMGDVIPVKITRPDSILQIKRRIHLVLNIPPQQQ